MTEREVCWLSYLGAGVLAAIREDVGELLLRHREAVTQLLETSGVRGFVRYFFACFKLSK